VKRVLLFVAMVVVVSSGLEALKIWVRDENGAAVRDKRYGDLPALAKGYFEDEAIEDDYLETICKMVVERGDNPFGPIIGHRIELTERPIAGGSAVELAIGINRHVIKKCFNLEQLLFEKVDLEQREELHVSKKPFRAIPVREFIKIPRLDWVEGLENLRLLYFIDCEGKIPYVSHEYITVFPNLKRVVKIIGEEETEIYARPTAVGIWQKILRLPGVNWFARRMAGWLGRTVTFHADPESPEEPPTRDIPEGVWKASFVGYEGLDKKSLVGESAKDVWEAFFKSDSNKANARGVKHLTIDGGTLYWVNFLHYFPNLRTIMLRSLKPMPESGDLVDEIGWDDDKFPPMLEDITIDGAGKGTDHLKVDIDDLERFLPEEVRLKKVR